MFAAVWVERIKKRNDVVTYQEILAFSKGEPIDRTTERSRRERMIPRWMKFIRATGTALIAAAIGGFVGYNIASMIDTLFG